MFRKVNIVHVGITGVPLVKSAAVNRCIAIYSLFPEDRYNMLAINNRSSNFPKDANIPSQGKFKNIHYYYTPRHTKKPAKFFGRRKNNFIGRLNEIKIIYNLSKKNMIDLIFYYPTGNFFELLLYRYFSKKNRIPLISHYVEYRSQIKSRKGIFLKINDLLFDNYFAYFVDGVIPISNYLINKIVDINPSLPFVKIPPITEFQNFKKSGEKISEKFFLFVGSSGYKDIIELILDSFKMVKDENTFLFLILSGDFHIIKKQIAKHERSSKIKVFSNLPYSEMVNIYMHAIALLIPLNKTIQDTARFPQKICEYLASSNPIITVDVGEIKYYFKDGENALVTKNCTALEISEKMNFVIENPKDSKIIGQNGNITGKKYFDSKNYVNKLILFVDLILKK